LTGSLAHFLDIAAEEIGDLGRVVGERRCLPQIAIVHLRPFLAGVGLRRQSRTLM
jgi:hypothetical protein